MELLYCDPSLRLVADCILMDTENVVVSDRKGSIAVLYTGYLEGKPELGLLCNQLLVSHFLSCGLLPVFGVLFSLGPGFSKYELFGFATNQNIHGCASGCVRFDLY